MRVLKIISFYAYLRVPRRSRPEVGAGAIGARTPGDFT